MANKGGLGYGRIASGRGLTRYDAASMVEDARLPGGREPTDGRHECSLTDGNRCPLEIIKFAASAPSSGIIHVFRFTARRFRVAIVSQKRRAARVAGKSWVDLNSKDERGIPAQEVEESWRLIIQFQDCHYLRPPTRFRPSRSLERLSGFSLLLTFSIYIRVDEFYEWFPPFPAA